MNAPTPREKILANAIRVLLATIDEPAGALKRRYARTIGRAALGTLENADEAQLRRFEAVMEGKR